MPGGLHPPIQVIATWRPNYVNPENRGWGIVALVIFLLTLTYIVVILRLWARFYLAKNSGIDDALIVFNMLPLTGLAIALCLAFKKYGFDRHVWDVPIPVLIDGRKAAMVLEALYLTSTATTKVSILLFYRRLSSGTISNGFLYSVYAAIAFVAVYYVIFTINLFIGCRPIHAFWMQVNPFWDGDYTCFDEASNLIAASTISVLQDFIACGMPTILFWKLKIPMNQKIALVAIFGVGFFICICGILRIVFAVPIYYDTYDMTWYSYDAWIWFAVEAHMAVVCASAPSLKSFFKHALGGSNWNSLQRPSTGPRKGYFTSVDASDSSAKRNTGQSKGQTITTMASFDHLRGSDSGLEGGSVDALPLQDVEFGNMSPEDNHAQRTRSL